ncbi:hypothetical protein [Enterobacter hormaechei]|uniref:hypothetical protein n=1 Tax=Enterobacter hormaechei TaxID=158836 RepID=UPI0023E47479|nr:hypothetical protein [Enterobacter hormaechei]MDF3686348.1 hypothetical protein [Enterobacter hormaechei]
MTEELVKVQLFFDSLKQEFVGFEKEAGYILKKQNDILQFSWPDDIQFDTWMADRSHTSHSIIPWIAYLHLPNTLLLLALPFSLFIQHTFQSRKNTFLYTKSSKKFLESALRLSQLIIIGPH